MVYPLNDFTKFVDSFTFGYLLIFGARDDTVTVV